MKTVLILGGSGGIGKVLTKIMKDKYNVTSLSSKNLDVRNRKECDIYFKTNHFDIVVNLAAYNANGFTHSIGYIDTANQVDTNVWGTLNVVQLCLKHFMRERGGNIILASSILADKAQVGTSIYSATKGFIESYVRTVAAENFNKNVYINAIQLGYFEKGLTETISEDIQQEIMKNIPARRWGRIEEVYNTIEYILNTSYVSGQTLRINGGLL
jgi:3-oxoacyl-[acyl-carrier protein] reductase